MIEDLKPYCAKKESGVDWLGKVPTHWGTHRLRDVAKIRFGNVDKHSREDESAVRLCNYSDVYYNDRIRADMDFMKATATSEEIERFRLGVGDVLITKDSESWDDIGVPALVESADADMICGYHLALLRPIVGRATGSFCIEPSRAERLPTSSSFGRMELLGSDCHRLPLDVFGCQYPPFPNKRPSPASSTTPPVESSATSAPRKSLSRWWKSRSGRSSIRP